MSCFAETPVDHVSMAHPPAFRRILRQLLHNPSPLLSAFLLAWAAVIGDGSLSGVPDNVHLGRLKNDI
jgi:hypothetical protein